jgi:hypothetical protein
MVDGESKRLLSKELRIIDATAAFIVADIVAERDQKGQACYSWERRHPACNEREARRS